MELVGKDGVETIYVLHRAISDVNGRHLGFTCLVGRMTEVLAPVIYIELTGQKSLLLQMGLVP
jgi:hypothetical protein